MAWPDDRDLPVEVEGAFGADLTADPGTWSWTDLSSRLRATPIILRAGRSGGAGRVSPGTCSVTLDNDDSALTPLHPLSPYWPNVELGTPIRTRIRRAEDAFARTVPSVTPLNSNPYIETNAAGWFAYDATVTRSTAWAHQGVASLLLTPDGVSAQAVADSEQVPVTVGATYRATAWVRCAVARNVHLGVNWYDASHNYMSTLSQADVALAANTATLLTFDATAPAGAAYASVNAVMSGAPPASHLLHIDEAMIGPKPAGGWGVADSGQAWTTSGTADDFSVSGGVARHIHSTVNVLRRSTLAVALADSEQMVDVAPSALLTGAALVTGLLFRYQNSSNYYWLRCEFNSGGTSVMLKITRCVGGTFTDLATINPLPGVPYAAGGYLRVRASVIGSRLALKAWNPAGAEPAGWTLTATDSSLTAAGATGMQSWLVAGNTNTLPVEARYRSYTARVDRFTGPADQWEPTYLPTGVVGEMSSAVRITASGILRRLQQGDQPDESPLRRTIAASNPVAYYPAEDGNVATAAGSALSGQNPLVVSGAVEFKPVEDFTFQTTTTRYGTSALADLAAGGSLAVNFGSDVVAATQSAWTVDVVGAFDVAFSSGDIVLMEWTTPGGPFTRWQLVLLKSTLHTQVIAYTGAGTPTVIVDRVGVLGGFRTWVVSAEQVGGSINVSYRMPGSPPLTGVVAGTTLGGVASMRVNPTGTTSSIPMPFGHLAVWANYQLPYDDAGGVDAYGDAFVSPAVTSYRREAAHVRLARLAAEDGIALSMPAVDADAVMRMGWQPPGVFADLAAECVDVDGGLLHESGFGLAYVPRSARYNKPVDLTIDLATYAVSTSGEVVDPTYDDQDIRNRWTVSRRDGSFAVADDVDSQRRGVYSDSIELNLADDSRLGDQAGWRVRLGTVVDLREGTFPIDLAANPGLIDGWLSCGVGSRVVRVNPPAQHRPGPLDRLVAGWTETIGPRSWMVQVMPEPAPPWDVATADGTQRAGAEGSTLAAALTSSATTLSLASTAENGVWTTDPTDFPLDMRVGGERVTASAIGAALADSFTRTGSNGWGTPDAGPAWTTSGGSASNYSTNGSAGVHTVDSVNVTRESVADVNLAVVDVTVTGVTVSAAPTGAAIHQAVAARYDASNYVELRVFRPTAGAPTVVLRQLVGGVETFNGFPTVAGATNTSVLSMRLQAVGSVLRGKVWITGQPEPEAWLVELTGTLLDAGDVAIRSLRETGNTNAGLTATYDSVAVTNLQTVALSARGVNGVQRAWPVGTEVDVWTPAIAPL